MDRKGRWTLLLTTLTERELAAIQADERPDVGTAGRRWKRGKGGGTGDEGGVDGGKGRGRWTRRGGNIARKKQSPN